MHSIDKAFGRSADTGRPLPDVYKSFAAAKIHFRLSATSMIAGAPGSFKSALALNLLASWARQGVYGLYFSADADEMTVAKRVGAILTGHPVDRVERGLRAKEQFYLDALAPMGDTRWVFKAVDVDQIDAHCVAFESVYGRFPHVIFVDNLLNMGDAGEDYQSARNMIRDLDILARSAGCHVCVLHHTSESYSNDGTPPPRAAVLGKIAQFPRLMLNVAAWGATFNVACVKNTNGSQDPSGKTFIPMDVDGERMTIKESSLMQQASFGGM